MFIEQHAKNNTGGVKIIQFSSSEGVSNRMFIQILAVLTLPLNTELEEVIYLSLKVKQLMMNHWRYFTGTNIMLLK